VLEEHLSAVEDRLKLENAELRQYYTDKLEKQKEDYVEQISNLQTINFFLTNNKTVIDVWR